MQLSIITINYNSAADLSRTVESVIKQTWKNFEYMIIDGGSTDESLKNIKHYENKIDFWVSEPDKGIFNAMNKGIKKATGDYLLMLNAGDVLYSPTTLYEIFHNKTYHEDILYGNVVLESNGKIIGEKVFPDLITFDFFRRASISHQASFIKRELHNKVGLYDENLKFSSDWKFFILSFCKYNVRTKHIGMFVALCNCDGITWSPKNFPAMGEEWATVLNENFSSFLADYRCFDRLRSRTNVLFKLKGHCKGFIKVVLRKVMFQLKLAFIFRNEKIH